MDVNTISQCFLTKGKQSLYTKGTIIQKVWVTLY